MNNKEITHTLFEIVANCFGLSEEYRHRLNLTLKIDQVYSWGNDTHALVHLGFEVEKKFGIEIIDIENQNLCSNQATLSMWFALIRKKINSTQVPVII